MAQGDISYPIGDVESYIEFIAELRQKFAGRKGDVVDDIFEDDKNRACVHPLLVAKPSEQKAVSWIHVELSEKEMGMQTTLVVRKDNLHVKGFMNKDRQWFELPGRDDNKRKLPGNYKAKELKGWDDSYMGIMKFCNKDQVKKTPMSTRLGNAFAERAVRRLSRYHSEDVDNNMDEHPTRLGTAGLIVMICEAARMNPFLDTIAGGWNGGTGLTSRLFDIMWDWGSMSAALLKWKESGYRTWPIESKRRQGTALASIHLVCLTPKMLRALEQPGWRFVPSLRTSPLLGSRSSTRENAKIQSIISRRRNKLWRSKDNRYNNNTFPYVFDTKAFSAIDLI